MIDDESAEETAEEPPLMDTFVDPHLANCKLAYDLGFVPVLYEVMCTAREFNVPMPNWAMDAMVNRMENALLERKMSTRIRKLRAEMKHFERWLKVRNARDKGDIKSEESYEQAMEESADEGDAVDIETIKASYKRIEERMQKPGDEGHIYWALERVQSRLRGL
jgi:hypothetical protein